MPDQKPVDIGAIASLEMPPVTTPPAAESPAKVSAVPQEKPAAAPAAKVEKDSLGRAFDPKKFRHERDTQGRWKNLNSGRKSKAAKAAANPAQESFIPDDPPVRQTAGAPGENDVQTAAAVSVEPAKPAGPDRFDLLADAYTRGGIALAMGLLSDEWKPDDDEEFVALRNSVAAYFRATGQQDLSPGTALAVAVVTYGAKRLPRPKTQSRISYFKEKAVAWWRGMMTSRAASRLPAVQSSN